VEPTLKPELHELHLRALLHFLQCALPFLHLDGARSAGHMEHSTTVMLAMGLEPT